MLQLPEYFYNLREHNSVWHAYTKRPLHFAHNTLLLLCVSEAISCSGFVIHLPLRQYLRPRASVAGVCIRVTL